MNVNIASKEMIRVCLRGFSSTLHFRVFAVVLQWLLQYVMSRSKMQRKGFACVKKWRCCLQRSDFDFNLQRMDFLFCNIICVGRIYFTVLKEAKLKESDKKSGNNNIDTSSSST